MIVVIDSSINMNILNVKRVIKSSSTCCTHSFILSMILLRTKVIVNNYIPIINYKYIKLLKIEK